MVVLWQASGMLRGTRRSGGEVREMLLNCSNPPTVEFHPRSDGPGSSQDLPQFLAMGSRIWRGKASLDESSWAWSKGCLRTPGICIDCEPIRFKAVPSTKERQVEYLAPDFHSNTIVATDVVPGLPEQFVNNILVQFGLMGIRIEAEPMPAVYRGTGLGGSNLAHAAALIFASALSGADLSLPQIYIWGTALENNFGVKRSDSKTVSYGVSITGGQEMLTAFQGGVFDNVHVPFIFGAHAVLSRELVPPESYPVLEKHLALVNLGLRRRTGVTSAGVNTDWMAAWAIPQQAAKHLDKAMLSYEGAEALRNLDFTQYADVLRKYRNIRTDLCARYTAGQSELDQLCIRNSAEYFPVGAGGGTCLVCSPDANALKNLVEQIKSTEDPAIGRVVIPFKVRKEGVRFIGFKELGLSIPAAPAEARELSQENIDHMRGPGFALGTE